MRTLALALTLAAAVSAGLAQTKDGPVRQPANEIGKQAQPANPLPKAADPKAVAILDRLEKAGDLYQRLQANVKVHLRDAVENRIQTGVVKYEAGTKVQPAKFAVNFESFQRDDLPATKDPIDYAFDGQWFTIVKHKAQQMTRFQVARPGQAVQPLAIGQGPFPLPLGQKTDEVLKYFTVTTEMARLRRPDQEIPKNADYVLLTTKPEHLKRLGFVYLEIWVDRTTNLPVKVVQHEGTPGGAMTKAISATLSEEKKVDGFEPATFFPPRKIGWSYDVKPLEALPTAAPAPAAPAPAAGR